MWESSLELETCIQNPDKRMACLTLPPSPRGPRTCDGNARNAMPHLPGYVHVHDRYGVGMGWDINMDHGLNADPSTE